MKILFSISIGLIAALTAGTASSILLGASHSLLVFFLLWALGAAYCLKSSEKSKAARRILLACGASWAGLGAVFLWTMLGAAGTATSSDPLTYVLAGVCLIFGVITAGAGRYIKINFPQL